MTTPHTSTPTRADTLDLSQLPPPPQAPGRPPPPTAPVYLGPIDRDTTPGLLVVLALIVVLLLVALAARVFADPQPTAVPDGATDWLRVGVAVQLTQAEQGFCDDVATTDTELRLVGTSPECLGMANGAARELGLNTGGVLGRQSDSNSLFSVRPIGTATVFRWDAAR